MACHFTQPLYDEFTVKGFFGDEVIVEIDGIVQSLKVNSSFHEVKSITNNNPC